MQRIRHLAWTLLVIGTAFPLSACGSGGGGGGDADGGPASSPGVAWLSSLQVDAGQLSPAFDPRRTTYTVQSQHLRTSTRLTPRAAYSDATIQVNGQVVASGAASALQSLTLGQNPVLILVTSADGSTTQTYTVVVQRPPALPQEAYIKASNPEAGDAFGGIVALSGDTLVVSASAEDSAATGINGDDRSNGAVSSGAVYVYVRSGTVWTQQAYIKASNTDAADAFGYSLDIDGDLLAVGAIQESGSSIGVGGNTADNSRPAAGAVYVFRRTGTTWAQEEYLKASNPGPSDLFGAAVAVSGDTVLVGAPSESSNATGVNGNVLDNTATWAGAAYVFVRTGRRLGAASVLEGI